IALPRAAAIDADHPLAREALPQHFFDALRPGTLWLQPQAAAVGARVRGRTAGTAVVALEPAPCGVHRHGRAALVGAASVTAGAPATVVAQEHRGIAAAVAEHQHLAPGDQLALHLGEQLRGQPGLQGALAHVDHAYRRGPGLAGALAQLQV